MNKYFISNLSEFIGNTVSGQTDRGDLVTLRIKYHTNGDKPDATLQTTSYDTFLAGKYNKVVINLKPYVHDTLSWFADDEKTKYMEYATWQDYIENYFGAEIRAIVETGARRFVYEVIK